MPDFKQMLSLKSDVQQNNQKLIPKASLARLDTTQPTPKPIVHSPDWEVRFDTTLSVFYFINTKTKELQFDHPDEVVSPLSSPITKSDSLESTYNTDHRKSTFGANLKRTLSPRFFQSSNSRRPKQNSTLSTNKINIKQNVSELSNELEEKNILLEDKQVDDPSSDMMDEQDEDIKQFKKLLELEMKY